jgi:polysaccharide export outer membrane protein
MRFGWFAIGILCFTAHGQPLVSERDAGAAASTTAPKPGLRSRNERYRLQPSDIIAVAFRFTPEFNQTLTVQPDGFISLEVAGELKVAGLTVEETKQAILEKCKGTLHDPVLNLTLVEFSKPYFVVNGQVQHPGKFDLHGNITVSDAIAVAGGFTPGAKDSEVLLFRRVSPEMAEVKRVDLKQILRNGKIDEDITLQASDSIYVSKSMIGKIERFMAVSKLGMYFNPIPWSF